MNWSVCSPSRLRAPGRRPHYPMGYAKRTARRRTKARDGGQVGARRERAGIDLQDPCPARSTEGRTHFPLCRAPVPVRTDLAKELSEWIRDAALTPSDRVFMVPRDLRQIFDRDLKAAGISKRDARGRTLDVHALRATFGTLLSVGGVLPRTAQQAMRQSDLR